MQHVFVKNIIFFLMFSRKIYFTAVNHLANRTVPEIIKSFKEVYQYYLLLVLRITKAHAEGELEHLNILIESLPEGQLENLAAANDHVPDIE